MAPTDATDLRKRSTPIGLDPDTFRDLGHQFTDQLADFLGSLSERPVFPPVTQDVIRERIGFDRGVPEQGSDPGALLQESAELLFDTCPFFTHPRFAGWITSAAAPIGILAEFLAATINQNVGPAFGAPTEIEQQTIRWIAEMLGYPTDGGGIFLSGGNLANMTAFHAARTAKTDWDIRTEGLRAGSQLHAYCSAETHTWVNKAADMSGMGTRSVRKISTDRRHRIDLDALRAQIEQDRDAGGKPFLVIGTAGTTSTGVMDPLAELADIADEYDCWFHVDAAYGGFASVLPEPPVELGALSRADSVVVDPHKWLYAPLEAGCVLVRDPKALFNAFNFRPPYYHRFDETEINYFELGPQNSRAFRALKVWLALQQVGRSGYRQMIAQDVALARALDRLVWDHPELEGLTQNLSITTFRYVPTDLHSRRDEPVVGEYLNEMNTRVMQTLLASGDAAISNAVVDDVFALRACIVNFRTALHDIEAIVELVVRFGRAVDAEQRPEELRA